MGNVGAMLGSKPVLYGGIAVAALLAYWYLHNGSGGSAASPAGPSIDYPYSLVYGLGAAQTGSGGQVATAPTSSSGGFGGSFSGGDQALIDLQAKQLELQHESLNLNYNLSVLQAGNQHDVDMNNIANTRAFQAAQVSSHDLETITSTFLAAQGRNPRLNGINASVNGETIGVTVVPQPTPNISTIPRFF